MIIGLDLPILQSAETLARNAKSSEEVLQVLRWLPLEDFGLLMISLPLPQYPNLSRLLPVMASDEVQRQWTGAAGLDLFRQTSAFVRVVESNFARHRKKGLEGVTIMDFGCGYGRILRMMYCFSAPAQIWGLDPWQNSLDVCRKDRLLGNLALSERLPQTLPVGDTRFGLIFAFSVFTHLPPKVAFTCLSTLRRYVANDGLLMITIRPVEFWSYIDGVRKTNNAPTLTRDHKDTGFAYLPHNGSEGETYGDTSLEPSKLETADWRVLGLDRSVTDPYQVVVVLEPR